MRSLAPIPSFARLGALGIRPRGDDCLRDEDGTDEIYNHRPSAADLLRRAWFRGSRTDKGNPDPRRVSGESSLAESMSIRFHPESRRALLIGLSASSILFVSIYLGSRGFKDFDTALVPYAGAAVFSAFGLGYRYSMWLRRPPTRLYWKRGWSLFLEPRRLPGNVLRLGRLVWDDLITQKFIAHRSWLRWSAHFGIIWGCLLAAAVTFPLSFGWVRFETARSSQHVYEAFVFGVHVFSFELSSALAPIVFNVLDIAAVLVIAGVFLSLWRRARDRGALAVQQFANDFLPLILLFAVSVTGLLLTASTHFMHGFHYGFLSQFHAVTVIFTLLYLPFGKFFHIFQRPAQLSLDFYRRAGVESGPAKCARCGGEYASKLHVEDLKRVQSELGIGYDAGRAHYQDVCPSCRRKSVALAQDALWRSARAEMESS
jgi:nitrate reductase gamma subunit